MPRYPRPLIALFLLALTTITTIARADDASVAVLGLEAVEMHQELALQVTEALRRVIGTQGVRMVPGKDLIELKMVFNCDGESPSCLAQAGKSLGADRLLYGSLSVPKGASKANPIILVTLKVLDVRSGIVEHSLSEAVPRKDLAPENLTQTIQRWLPQLLPIEAKPVLRVTSEPSGANIAVPGRHLGRTPLTIHDLDPGSYPITISLRGFRTTTRTVQLRPGGSHDVAIALEVEPIAITEPVKPSPSPVIVSTPPKPAKSEVHNDRYRLGSALRISGGALLGLGAAAGVTAIVLFVQYQDLQGTVNGLGQQLAGMLPARPAVGSPEEAWFRSLTCSPPAGIPASPTREQFVSECEKGERMAAATTAMIVVGGALGAAGITLVAVGQWQVSRSRKQLALQSLSPWYSPTSAGLTTSFRF